MPIELLIAPPATGKTETCIQRIKDIRSAKPLANIWVVVPDRQKASYFRQRLVKAGGGIGITIGTFRDLCVEILESNGVFTPVVTPALEFRLIQETVDAAIAADELDHYGVIAHKPGFILVLQDAFAELRGAYVKPEAFVDYTRNSPPARFELAGLYNRFLARLQQMNLIDMEGQSWLAVDVLDQNPRATSGIRLVIVDGFTSFTGVRRELMSKLSTSVEEMLITLPGERDSVRQVNRRSKEVVRLLKEAIHLHEQYLSAEPYLGNAPLHLEKHFLETGQYEKVETPRPIMLNVRSQTEEVREALRWIKELNIRKDIALSDCAIFVSNLEAYQPLLRAAANEFGVRVYFSHPEELLDSPAVKSLLTLLKLPGEDYNTRSLLNILHSPYFDFGLDARMVQDLEKVSQQAIIVMGREQWNQAWKMLEKFSLADFDYLDEDRHIENHVKGIDLTALRTTFEKFWHIFDQIDTIQSQRGWIVWLEKKLDELKYFNQLSSEWDWEAYQSLGDALKALVMSESVAGLHEVTYPQFLSDLEGTLNGARVQEPRESRRNSVLVGRMIEARASRFKAVALLGLSEGLFPVVENPDPFLNEELRHDLKMEPRLGREQASIFYQAFTRTDEHLLLTRPYLSENGEKWDPSPYWLSAKELLTDNCLQKIQPSTPRPQADAASPQELLFWSVQQNEMCYETDDLATRRQILEKGRIILNARRSKHASGLFEGNVNEIRDYLASSFTPTHIWSPTRLEEYGTCPYEFFVRSVLKLVEKQVPELGLDLAQRGSIYHEILESVYQQAGPRGDIQMLQSLLLDAANSVFLKAPQKHHFRVSPLWEVEKEEMISNLSKTLIALEEYRNDWTPICFEAKFGDDKDTRMILDLGSEKILIHGTIDRIDKNSIGEIRVIDYKSGSSNLTERDLKSGRRLQIGIYAKAAQDALHLGNVTDGFYWNISGGEPLLRLSRVKYEDLKGLQAVYERLTFHLERIMKGIRVGEFFPKVPKGGCPKYCPATNWCWRYHPGFRGG